MNIKDITMQHINSLLFTENLQNTTQIFPHNHNVRFLPCQHRGVGAKSPAIRVRAKPCVHRLVFPDLPQVPVRASGHS